jgi:AAA+ ATPase superfamily predicted ATPase
MKKQFRNPFVISGYVSPEYFCDREAESKELLTAMLNGRNMALISPRRMGKTGLVEHCFHNEEVKREFNAFFVDIYATGNLKEFVFIFGKQIFEANKSKGEKFLNRFFSVVSSLRPAFKLDPVTGAPSFEIGVGDIRQPEYSLEQIFAWLESADKPCIVAIDEFQQITKYPEKNIEAILRTHIQRCKNTTFIFAGSQRHMMQNIFFSASRPFYQSVSLLYLDAIVPDEYVSFVQRHFKKADKTVSKEVICRIYDIFEGHTWYIQNIFHRLFTTIEKGEEVTLAIADECLRSTVNSYKHLFQETINLLPERQRELLYAIGKERKTTEITSAQFIGRNALLSASSVQTAARQLLDKEILTKEDNSYMVYDRFMGLWLSEVYGLGYSLSLLPPRTKIIISS